MSRYEVAKNIYADYGADTEAALNRLKEISIAVHCWQGDDVCGFDLKQALYGGIQTTGNYPGKARTPKELMEDYDRAFSMIPGKKKLNLHASYAILGDEAVGRDQLEPKHFAPWVEFAKARGMGIDFNPTFFSHPMVKDGLTLSSPDDAVRCDALDRVFLATDYFDASINRIAAWVAGVRNLQKALLFALLQPNDTLKTLQENGDLTALLVLQEEMKTAPFGEVWAEYLRREDVPADYLTEIRRYEQEVLVKRDNFS